MEISLRSIVLTLSCTALAIALVFTLTVSAATALSFSNELIDSQLNGRSQQNELSVLDESESPLLANRAAFRNKSIRTWSKTPIETESIRNSQKHWKQKKLLNP